MDEGNKNLANAGSNSVSHQLPNSDMVSMETPKPLRQGAMSLNNSIGMEDFMVPHMSSSP